MELKIDEIHIVISGTVQGVGFRYATRNTAREAGLVGWVRNRDDGTVEVLAQGPAARVERLLAWCHEGPPLAQVTSVEVLARLPRDRLTFEAFDIRRE